MIGGDLSSQAALGFLTVLEHEQQGFVGGYLVLNTSGRPLEFHCTTPIKPNRAQQILFGPTLDAYLYGEQIGQTLISKCSLDLLAVCTDVELALAVRDYVSLPVALVLADPTQPSAESGVSSSAWRVDAAHQVRGMLTQFSVGRNRLAVPGQRATDQESIRQGLDGMVNFDLLEPFERIREAVEEAQRGSRA